MANRFRLIAPGMRHLLNDPGVTTELERRMRPALSVAQAEAPYRSGAYKNSLRLETVKTDRTVVRLIADVPYALVVEASTGNLTRALDAAGGD